MSEKKKYLLILEVTVSGDSCSGKDSYEYTIECEPEKLQSKIKDKKSWLEMNCCSSKQENSSFEDLYYHVSVTQVLPL